MTGFRVFTNLAISFDGKISTADRAHIDPSPYDRCLMDFHRARADAVLMGATTLRSFRRPVTVARRRYRWWRRLTGRRLQPLNVILARHLDFDPGWPFFADSAIERLLVVPEGTPERALEPFLGTCRVFRYVDRPDFPRQLVEQLRGLGCRNLLLEGGGGVMFPWAEQDLVDEWNVTVRPCVIGGKDAPTMVEGEGFEVARIKSYRLRRQFRRRDEVFLQYVRK